MIHVMEKSAGKVLGIQVDGKLVHADYEKFVPMLEKIIEEHGKVRCYMELVNFHGFTPRAMWDDLKFDIKHCLQVERCAIVGCKTSHKWMTKLGGLLFIKTAMKYFDVSQTEEAWDWINEGQVAACGCGGSSETNA